MLNSKRMFTFTPNAKIRAEYEVFKMAELGEYLSTCKPVEAFVLGSRACAYDYKYRDVHAFDPDAEYVLVEEDGNLCSASAADVEGLTPMTEVDAEAKKLEDKFRELVNRLDPAKLAILLEDKDLLRAYGVQQTRLTDLNKYKYFEGANDEPFDDDAPYVKVLPEIKGVVSFSLKDLATRVHEDPTPVVNACVNEYKRTGRLAWQLAQVTTKEYLGA